MYLQACSSKTHTHTHTHTRTYPKTGMLKVACTSFWFTGALCTVSTIAMHSYVQGHSILSTSTGRSWVQWKHPYHRDQKTFFSLETIFPDPVEVGFLGFVIHKSYFLPSSSWPCMTVTAMPWLSVSHRPFCWCWMRPLLLLIPSQLRKLLFHSLAGLGVCCLPCTLKYLSSPTALYNFIINKKLNC